MKAMFDCGGNTRQRPASARRHERNSLDPKKGRFPEIDDAVFTFYQERRKTGLFVSYDLLREEAIKKARSLNIPQSCFKASKGWSIGFMHQTGTALQRGTICQKKWCMSNALDGSEDVIVWEYNVEDKDDSDWVESTDNDSVMSVIINKIINYCIVLYCPYGTYSGSII
jgi:hypothetical protein